MGRSFSEKEVEKEAITQNSSKGVKFFKVSLRIQRFGVIFYELFIFQNKVGFGDMPLKTGS